MTVQSTTIRVDYNGNGITTAFSYPYRVYDSSHFEVSITDADGVVTAQALTTDYTVTLAADFSAATITMLSAAPATGERLTIALSPPSTQLTDLQNFDGTPSDIIERVFDLAALRDARQDEQLSRTISFGSTSQVTGITIADPVANNFLRVSADGLSIEMSTGTSSVGGGDMDASVYDPATIGEQIVGLTATQTLTNKTLTGPTLTEAVLNTSVSGTAVLDEDDMVSDSAVKLATQQSIKAYVDAQVAGAVAGDQWGDAVDASIVPDTDGAYDLGSNTKYFDNAYILTINIDAAFNLAAGVSFSMGDESFIDNNQIYFSDGTNEAYLDKSFGVLVSDGTGSFQANANALQIDDGTESVDMTAQIMRWTNGAINAGLSASDSLTIGARDVDGAAYTAFITLTSNNTPTCNLSSAVTHNSQAILNASYLDTDTLLAANSDSKIATQKAVKAYTDAAVSGLTNIKASCAVATTANITLSGEQTLDGVLTSTSRVLVKNQSTASQNGIYVSAAGSWSRATDLDDDAEIPYAAVLVTGGSTQAGSRWQLPISSGTVGSTDLNWVQIDSTSSYTAGTGLSLGGNVFSIDSSVVTLTGSQTLTNKTLTNPTIANLNGTAINNCIIGASTPAAANFTTAQTTGTVLMGIGGANANASLPYDLTSTNIGLSIKANDASSGGSNVHYTTQIVCNKTGGTADAAALGASALAVGSNVDIWGATIYASANTGTSNVGLVGLEVGIRNFGSGAASNGGVCLLMGPMGYYKIKSHIQLGANFSGGGTPQSQYGIVYNHFDGGANGRNIWTDAFIHTEGYSTTYGPTYGINFDSVGFGTAAINIVGCTGTYGIRDTGAKTIGIALEGAYSSAIRFLGSGSAMISGGASTGYTNGIDLRNCNFSGGYEIITDGFQVTNGGAVGFPGISVEGSAGALVGYARMAFGGAVRKVPVYAV